MLPGNVNAQVEEVCDKLAGMKELEGGFNMIGFSQAGQFLRVGRFVDALHALGCACQKTIEMLHRDY